jgi:hypothetical protein
MRLFVHGHFCLSSKGTSNKFCNIHGTKGIKSGHYLAAISCFRSSLLHGHDIRLSSTVFQYHPISGFYGAESTIPAPATPAKNGEMSYATPPFRLCSLSSPYSLATRLHLTGGRPAAARSWRRARRPTTGLTRRPAARTRRPSTSGSALVEESKEADDGLDEEAGGGLHEEAVDRRRMRRG